MTLFQRLQQAWSILISPDFESTRDEITQGIIRYRLRRVRGGYQPEILYTAGSVKRAVWFPLTKEGYWVEPGAFSFGNVTKSETMTRQQARRAVEIARTMNSNDGNRLVPVT